MINDLFVTKIGMTQAWTDTGKRLAVTRCRLIDNLVVGQQVVKGDKNKTQKDHDQKDHDQKDSLILEVGFGRKKISNVPKPLRARLAKSGFSFGVQKVRGVPIAGTTEELEAVKKQLESVKAESKDADEEATLVGGVLKPASVLTVGDVVKVQGLSKGKGFAGAVKRYGFAGGPATHGQSDRERAVGSIGAGTDPGKVWKGKKMPGRMGHKTVTVTGLKVIYLDPENQEIWLSGPVPGAYSTPLRLTKTGSKPAIKLQLPENAIDNQTEEKVAAA